MYLRTVLFIAGLFATGAQAGIVTIAPQIFIDTDTQLEWSVTPDGLATGFQTATPAQFLQLGAEYIGPLNDGAAPLIGGAGPSYYAAADTFLEITGFEPAGSFLAQANVTARLSDGSAGVISQNPNTGPNADLDVGGYFISERDASGDWGVRGVPETRTWVMMFLGFVGLSIAGRRVSTR